MATKRMIARSVTDDDRFVEMSASAQALYMHLNMSADDDGFCNQVSICMFRAHASVDDLETLARKKYIMQFESGVIVVKHWRMANALRKDRYTETNFQKELALLSLDEKSGVYHWKDNGCQLVAERLPDGCQMVATDKIRLEEIRVDKNNITVSNDTVCRTQEVLRIIEAWNAIDDLPKLSKISSDTNRGKMLKARIADYGVDDVIKAIENIRCSSFLRGKGNKGWTITFDWFVKPNNFIKVLEGNYSDAPSKITAPDKEYIQKFLRGEV